MIKFLNNRPFWVHILLALGIIFLILFLFVVSLDWITRHGESSTVPLVTGKTLSEGEDILEDKGFEIVIQDSVFYDSIQRGMILKQVPEADAVVKVNRQVYVTINRFVPPDVELPKLTGLTFKNAEMVIKNLGLRIGDTTHKADFAKNTVLEVLHNGRPLQVGSTIKMGSTLDLVISSGIGDEYIPVPDLLGLTYSEARALLDANGIILGAHIFGPDVRDSSGSYVYKQRPAATTPDGKRLSLRAGQMVDIWLQKDMPDVDSLRKLNQPSLNLEEIEE